MVPADGLDLVAAPKVDHELLGWKFDGHDDRGLDALGTSEVPRSGRREARRPRRDTPTYRPDEGCRATSDPETHSSANAHAVARTHRGPSVVGPTFGDPGLRTRQSRDLAREVHLPWSMERGHRVRGHPGGARCSRDNVRGRPGDAGPAPNPRDEGGRPARADRWDLPPPASEHERSWGGWPVPSLADGPASHRPARGGGESSFVPARSTRRVWASQPAGTPPGGTR